MTQKPAEIFGLSYGKLEEHRIADLTVIDLEKERTVNKKKFASKGKNTPFDHWKLKGFPVMTIAEGKVVYRGNLHE